MLLEKIQLSDEGDDAYIDAYIADPTKGFTRKAILVIPGGGYSCVCSDREGEPIAQAFMPYGYNAFVLHYHVKKEKTFPIQLIQATKAIKYIKDHAEHFGIDPEQLFVVGFSAGGHLAASVGTLWKHPEVLQAVPMSYGYNKPTGVMLIYPVISSDFHVKSFEHLLCTKEPTEQDLAKVSLEKHVDKDSAPAFIIHTSNDQIVDVRNSLRMAEAYKIADLQFEMHIYPDAPHGAALANEITWENHAKWKNSSIAEWVRMAADWAHTLIQQ
jgi:acetyl esterase/lipase